MDKIASPQDLQAELHGSVTFIHASEKPDRQVIASKLRELADRVVGFVSPSLQKAAGLATRIKNIREMKELLGPFQLLDLERGDYLFEDGRGDTYQFHPENSEEERLVYSIVVRGHSPRVVLKSAGKLRNIGDFEHLTGPLRAIEWGAVRFEDGEGDEQSFKPLNEKDAKRMMRYLGLG